MGFTNPQVEAAVGTVTIPDGSAGTAGGLITLGDSADAALQYNTTQTPDTLHIGVSSDSRAVVISEKADMGADFAHAQQTNPTLFVHSADAATPADYVGITHNQTDGQIDVGAGDLKISAAGANIRAVTTPGGTTLANLHANNFQSGVISGTPTCLMTAALGFAYGTNSFILTAGTMTGNTIGHVRPAWYKFEWTNAMVTALGAATSGNVAVCTLPAKTLVKRCIVVLTGAAAGPATVTVSVGRTGAGYIDYIVASDAKAAANTVYGDAIAEVGTNLKDSGATALMDDLPSYTGTTLINAQFVSTGANLNTVTGSTGIVYLQTELLP